MRNGCRCLSFRRQPLANFAREINVMNIRIAFGLVITGWTAWLNAQTNLPSVITEHADIRINYTAAGTNNLSLVVRDEDHALDYQTNQIVLVAVESSKL